MIDLDFELDEAIGAIRVAVDNATSHVEETLRVVLAAHAAGDDEFMRAAILHLIDDVRGVPDDLRHSQRALAGADALFRQWARRRPGGAVDLDRCGPEVVAKLRAEFERAEG